MEEASLPTKSPSSFLELIVDNRERLVHPAINAAFMLDPIFRDRHTPAVILEQMTVGDYIIQLNKRPVAVIERKTLADFAASLKDGRDANTDKLFALAGQYERCDVFFIIEGKLGSGMETQVGHIPYKNILAAIRLLQIRRGVQLIHSKDVNDTALQLKFLCEVYSGMFIKGELTIEGASREDALDSIKPSEEEEISRTRVKMWATLKGVSLASAPYYLEAFGIRDLLLGKIVLGDFKVNGMRKPTAVVQESIADVHKKLSAKAAILACIKGVSDAQALKILDQVSIEDLLGDQPLEIYLDSGKNKTRVQPGRLEKWRAALDGGQPIPKQPSYLAGLFRR